MPIALRDDFDAISHRVIAKNSRAGDSCATEAGGSGSRSTGRPRLVQFGQTVATTVTLE